MGSAARILTATAAVLMAVTFIFYVVSNAVPRWGEGRQFEVGLWRSCAVVRGERVCGDHGDCSRGEGCAKLHAARAFMTLACIFSGLAVLVCFARVLDRLSSNRILAAISLLFCLFPLIAGIIGVATGGSVMVQDLDLKFAAAAIVGVVGLIINLLALIIAGVSFLRM